jgi:hypothetical protein
VEFNFTLHSPNSTLNEWSEFMSVTVTDVFHSAMALCDYTDENGAVLNNKTVSTWLKKSTKIADIGQRDLLTELSLIKCREFNERDFVLENGKKKFALPNDYISAEGVSPENIATIKEGFVYLPKWFEEKLILTYKASPLPLVNETSTFSVDDNSVLLTIPYFLAANFLIEENPAKANYFLSQYNENKQKLLAMRSYKVLENIEDVYDTSLKSLEC